MRHGRQSRLADVGAAGQGRIEGARVALSGAGLSGAVEARYLAGAGALALEGDEASIAEARRVDARVRAVIGARRAEGAAADEIDALDPAAREVGRGALAALRALKRALAGEAQ